MFIELEILYISANRLANFYIDVSNNADGSSAEQCAYDNVPYGASETRVYTCPDGIYGRYVRVRYAPNKQDHLQLCEVQVQGRGMYYQNQDLMHLTDNFASLWMGMCT